MSTFQYQLSTAQIPVQKLTSNLFNDIDVDVLRVDALHNIVSGNKWFKLKYYIEDCLQKQQNTLATYGGTFSNHIVATAFACKKMGLKSIGIIRGEATKFLSHTLQEASNYGMELHFVNRTLFKEKANIKQRFDNNIYWVHDGGYGTKGMQGAADMLQLLNAEKYTHIMAACGIGTMLAGLVSAAKPHQKIIGISVFKNNNSLENDIYKLLQSINCTKQFTILHNYHFGGYAKHPQNLITWMNELYEAEKLPSDIVYTSKLFYAVKDLCSSKYFNANDKVLIIHSGGLQGNLSLPQHTLCF